MQIEHLALNLDGASEAVAWYAAHLGLPIRRQRLEPIYCAFLGEGPTLLEIYCNPAQPRLDLRRFDPLTLHLAFTSCNLAGDLARLVTAGAVHVDGCPDASGHGLILLRCPWGLPIQLCRRPEPI